MFAEHPMLPYERHKFLRLSSKISGRQCFAAGYIREVCRLAKARLGERVRGSDFGMPAKTKPWKEVMGLSRVLLRL
jgi:hypothetical protein